MVQKPVMKLSLPPRVKVLEALSAIADERIRVLSDKIAQVISSDRTRQYTVILDLENRVVYSNDNGTKYRRYIGYPIISFLMIKRILEYNDRLAQALRGIPWKRLNETYKRYIIVERIVKDLAKKKGIEPHEIDEFIDKVMSQLEGLELYLDETLPHRYGLEL